MLLKRNLLFEYLFGLQLYETIINLQKKKVDINIKTKSIEKKSKNIMLVWERKLLEKLPQISCSNIISLERIC